MFPASSVIVGVSCKRTDQLRDVQATRVRQAIGSGEIETGRGLNQERTLRRPGDTRSGLILYLSLPFDGPLSFGYRSLVKNYGRLLQFRRKR